MAKWATITNPLNSTASMFGGKWGNDISRYLNGIDMGAVDSDKEPVITTNTRYGFGKLKLYDVDATHTVEFQADNIVSGSNRVLKIRALTVATSDYIVTDSQPATLLGKTLGTNTSLGALMDANQNSIIRIDSVGLRDITGDNVDFVDISGTGANSTINVMKNYAGVLGATDIKVQFGESSKINAFEWFSTIPGPSTKLFDILPNQINTYVDLDMNGKAILNYNPAVGDGTVDNNKIAVHTSTKITITTKAQLNANIVYSDQANVFGAFSQTIPSGNLKISGNGGFSNSLLSGTLAGNIDITLPNATSTLATTTDTRFTDSRTPLSHATSHKSGGSDLIKVNELAASTTNNTATNSTTTVNGTLRMLSGDATQYIDGSGAWSVPQVAGGQFTGNIRGNVATASGNGTTKIFTIAHALSTTPATAIVKPNSINAFGEFTTAIDSTNITITYQVAPPSGTSNLAWQWIAMDPAAHLVINSYSTVGTGVAVTKAKVNSDLPFRSLLAGSAKLTLTQNTNDITINVDETQFTTSRPPTTHATTHKTGGSDAIKVNELAASTTNTTATNSTTTVNGTLPILSGVSTQYLSGAGTWTVPAGGGGSGEINTASNFGTVGTGLWKDKNGVDLRFYKINPLDNKVSIALNGTDRVDIGVVQANLAIGWSQITSVPTTLVKTDQGNTFGDFAQTFASSGIKMMNPLATFGTIIENSAISGANRTLTLPLLTANDTIAVLALAQTLTNKTLTAPKITTIVVGTETLTLPTATDQLVGRATTDTLTNKTLTAPKIATISNNNNTLTLPTTVDTMVGRATTDTLTNKNVDMTNNTVTDTGAAIGGIPVHNGTKYLNKVKGSDGTYLGVQSGVVGYYTPTTGGTPTMPNNELMPSSGRWGALWGGTTKGDGLFSDSIATYDTIVYDVTSSTGSAAEIWTDNVDDAIAEIKIPPILARQSNPKLKLRIQPKSSSGMTMMFGFSSSATLPTGGSHDTPLNNASGIMVTCSQDVESFYQISRNDGGATQTKTATTVASNNTTPVTFDIDINTTDCSVLAGGVEVGRFTTEVPALTTPLYMYIHIEAIGSTSRGIGVRYMQVTCL